MSATVWFNKNLSSTYQVIEILRREQHPGELRIFCSHTHPDYSALRLADVSELEPKGLGESDYLAYCLEMVRRHDVRVFVPGKMTSSVSRERERFESVGTQLLVAADAPMLRKLKDKEHTYEALRETSLRLPEYRRVNSLEEFDAAYADLRGRHARVCFKPTESVFGLGFRIVMEEGGALKRLLSGAPFGIGLEEARRCFGESARFRSVLVMQYLPGTERSVDCLARAGELIRCVIRRKPDVSEGGQLLEVNSEIEEKVRELTAHLRLTGLFNVQFKDDGGEPYLLEINPRMSGGLPMACLSGVAFPLWAIRLLLGTAHPEDIPQPVCGVRVKDVSRAIRL
ncbi:MAG: ATP-grasp domain-containing protein [Planctomycetaceae bacterium]